MAHQADVLPVKRQKTSHSNHSNTRPDPVTVYERGQPTSLFLSRVRGIEERWNSNGLSLSDILSPLMGTLVDSAQFNYCIDLDWLVSQYPREYRGLPMTLVHGAQRGSDQYADLIAAASRHPGVIPVSARLDLPYGTHHTKMMLLRCVEGLRVVVHTANLVPGDWGQKTQGVWVSPMFPKRSGDNSSSPREFDFGADLIAYLSAYRNSGLSSWISRLREYDLSSAKVVLVGSVPGRHLAEGRWNWGHGRLRTVLRRHAVAAPTYWPVIGQFSSVGTLGADASKWVRGEFLDSLSAPSVAPADLSLIFPSVDNVRTSLEGYAAGASLPYSVSVARKQPWLSALFHQWRADRSGRSAASPHIKTYCRVSSDCQRLSWFLLTSANLSKAAWGAFEKNQSQLMIRNYELGVVLFPQLLGDCDWFDLDAFPVPYDLPLTAYRPNDRPWLWDQVYDTLPDRHGNDWDPS